MAKIQEPQSTVWRKGMNAVRQVFVLLCLALVVMSPKWALAYTPPALSGAINDTANLLTPAERAQLEARVLAHRSAHGNEIVVFTVPSLGTETIEDVAYSTFNTWKIGRSGKDDGVLLVIAPTERRTRIETGKGVGGAITDLQSKRILSERVGPRLKQGQSFLAIRDGVDSIASLLLGGPLVPDGGTSEPAPVAKPVPLAVPDVAPTSVLVDTSSSVPEAEHARYLASYETRKKEGKAGLAVIVVSPELGTQLPSVAGANLASFTKAWPSTRAIAVATSDGKGLFLYVDSRSETQGRAALDAEVGRWRAALRNAKPEDRAKTLVDGAIAAQNALDVAMPGYWERRMDDGSIAYFMVGGILFVIVFLAWLFNKLGWLEGGGGSSGSSGSGYSGGRSSGGYSSGGSGGGYSGGGGSSGGGGASDSY